MDNSQNEGNGRVCTHCGEVTKEDWKARCSSCQELLGGGILNSKTKTQATQSASKADLQAYAATYTETTNTATITTIKSKSSATDTATTVTTITTIKGKSYFDGSAFEKALMMLGAFFAFVLTLGLATPWLVVWFQKWHHKHTVIEGVRLQFIGTGGALFGRYFLWWFLSIITFGIFIFFVSSLMRKWIAKNTIFAV
ncbi:MAG: YjgN family protein [Defluviitaleaceae bacterium]|nr:YjgN family protein [Defluviitaleaceae bacterium]